MTAPALEDVITKSITVQCTIEVAFKVWTEQITVWWPQGHSLSGNPSPEVFIEGKAGGRFYERTPDGVEYDWGEITVWDPPHRLVYNWYLGSDPKRPTRVDVRFTARGPDSTRVDIEHRGPELIGELWVRRSPGFNASWEELLPHYIAACHFHRRTN
jgi:uncharacterized protein YndB with AHSA1/START domain